jgi:hypothetical protein
MPGTECGIGFLVHPFVQRDVLGEKASTVTFVPLDFLFFVDKATTITLFVVFARVKETARLMVLAEY